MASEPTADRPYAPGYFVREDTEAVLPWSWAVAVMDRVRNPVISTVRPGGRSHAMPIWGIRLGSLHGPLRPGGSETLTADSEWRYRTHEELTRCLTRSGFAVEQIYGDCHRCPLHLARFTYRRHGADATTAPDGRSALTR